MLSEDVEVLEAFLPFFTGAARVVCAGWTSEDNGFASDPVATCLLLSHI